MRKMISYKTIVLFMFVALYGCGNGHFQKKQDGIVISLTQKNENDVQTICLQVISDDIIRVIASPDKNIKERKSLIALDSQQKTKWNANQSGDSIILKTATTQAIVRLSTGEICFTDSVGRVILAEQTGGGKSFESIEVEGKKGYSFRQVFESPSDEAFYGLGQHQSDE